MSTPAFQSPSASPSTRYSIAGRLNRLPIGTTHRYAILVIGLGLFFDAYEIFLAGTLSTVLKAQFHLGDTALRMVLASAFVGQFIGAIAMGRLSDRIGRRAAFLLNLAIYSICSILAAFAMNVSFLVIARFIAGLGLGAEAPVADAYLSDLLPSRGRGRFMAWTYTVGFLGVPAVGILGRVLVPRTPLGLAGWRWMFLLGGAGALVIWFLRRRLPESPRWLESVGRNAEAERIVSVMEQEATRGLAPGHGLPEPDVDDIAPPPIAPRALLRAPYLRRTGMLVVLDMLETVGYYGFGTLVPLLLAAKGFDVVTSLTFTALSFFGYPIGSALSVFIIERFERKWIIVASALAMTFAGLAFGFARTPALIIGFGFTYTALSNILSNAFHIYGSELFPTGLRGTAVGACYSTNRLSTAALPFVLLPLLTAYGSGAVFGFIAAAMAIVALNVAWLGPATTGLALEQISPRDTRSE